MEHPIIIGYPVYTLDRRELLPAGTECTPSVLEDLSASGAREKWPEVALMDYDTVRRDMRRRVVGSAYRHIFHEKETFDVIEELMEPVRFPLPVLEGLSYFREHDFYTYRHILMVFALSCLLAREGAENSEQMHREASSGPLHDLGKICIPMSILKKASPLRLSEKNYIEHHSIAGYLLLTYYLRSQDTLSALVARDHHERRDGSGYPRGIRLDNPQVEIISACDVFDALTMPRPYRKTSYDNRTALEELTSLAERGKLSWKIVRRLIALSRIDHPDPESCVISSEKRGSPPLENCYGVTVEEGDEKDSG